MNLKRVQDLLAISEVSSGVLEVPGANSTEMFEIYNILSHALMENEIPHYRVIGVRLKGSSGTPWDVLDKVRGTDKSYIELICALKDVIFSKGGGNPVNDNQTYVTAGMKVGFMAAYGEVTTSNGAIIFSGEGSGSQDALVRDINLINLSQGGELLLVTRLGTGMLDFHEAGTILGKIFQSEKNRYIPVRAVYDLNDIISIGVYREVDGSQLRFLYKMDVNEAVLTDLIHRFSETLSRKEDN